MKFGLILPLLAVCLLTAACAVSSAVGARLEPPPINATQPCQHPTEFLPPPGEGDWELIAGRVGDELIACRKRHDVLRVWVEGVMAAINQRS